MPEVLVIHRRLTHYRVPLFERLRAELAERGITFRLAHGEATPGERLKDDAGELSWAERLPTRYAMGGRLCWLQHGQALEGADLVVLTPENKIVSNLPVQYLSGRRRVALWGHGANLQGRPDSLRERFKRRVARQADWWFGYTEMSRPLIERTGFPVDRLTILNNAVDTGALRSQLAAVTAAQTASWRERLGLQGDRIGIFVGSLYAEKRIGFLLDAALELRRRVPDFELVVVGSGPDAALVTGFCAQHPWAHHAGVLRGGDKASLLSMARAMLNPGLVGLGILDAFVAEVPMVTTDCGLHSPEVAYLQHGTNGIMCANQESAFVQAVLDVLTDDAHWQHLRRGCETSAALYTVENMAQRFALGLEQALAATPWRGRG